MSRFWVYENWTHDFARLHRAECRFCNDGRGMHAQDSGRNGAWRGPFADRDSATRAMDGTRRVTRSACKRCVRVRPAPRA